MLQEYFLDARIECGAKIFESIAKLPRFKMVSMLLPKKDKEILELLKNKYAR